MDNLWFGVFVIATLAAAGWYAGTTPARPATLVIAALGVLLVAAVLGPYVWRH